MEEMITISLKTYNELLDSELVLESLITCGVDNWIGWDEARQLYREWKKEERNG